MAKERADVHAKEAFTDSQELLNGCCPLRSSRSLFPRSASCRQSVTEPESQERCVEAQGHLHLP